MKLFNSRNSRSAAPRAFTIIEIALCLGIIAFALVAIIAVLPRGLDVQKRNREETIISHDADVWMSAIRGGAHGYDDLTNYVICITNFWTTYDINNKFLKSGFDYYTPADSKRTSINPATGDFPLTNGEHIIGLLSTPKWTPIPADSGVPMNPYIGINSQYQSNYMVCYARAFSGAAVDKAPQTNKSILGDSFIYRMIVENFPYAPVDTNAFCQNCIAAQATNGMSPAQLAAWLANRKNLMSAVWTLQADTHDFRLRFRWPVLPNGSIPNAGLATFRAMADGELVFSNDVTQQPQYFVRASTYVTNSPP